MTDYHEILLSIETRWSREVNLLAGTFNGKEVYLAVEAFNSDTENEPKPIAHISTRLEKEEALELAAAIIKHYNQPDA